MLCGARMASFVLRCSTLRTVQSCFTRCSRAWMGASLAVALHPCALTFIGFERKNAPWTLKIAWRSGANPHWWNESYCHCTSGSLYSVTRTTETPRHRDLLCFQVECSLLSYSTAMLGECVLPKECRLSHLCGNIRCFKEGNVVVSPTSPFTHTLGWLAHTRGPPRLNTPAGCYCTPELFFPHFISCISRCITGITTFELK